MRIIGGLSTAHEERDREACDDQVDVDPAASFRGRRVRVPQTERVAVQLRLRKKHADDPDETTQQHTELEIVHSTAPR
jgi:hypothetical protein